MGGNGVFTKYLWKHHIDILCQINSVKGTVDETKTKRKAKFCTYLLHTLKCHKQIYIAINMMDILSQYN